MMVRFFSVAFGLIVANYLYQAVGAQNWITAFDRSFFQLAALVAAFGSIYLAPIDRAH